MRARLAKIGRDLQIVALISSARLIGRLPIPGRHKQPIVRWLGIRAFLIVLGAKLNARRTPKLLVVSDDELMARLARPRSQ